jgi:hypothetical protein
MGAKGFVIAEEGHVVNILPAQSISGAVTSDVFSMKGHGHCSILVSAGSTNADAGNITIAACDDFVPTNETAIDFAYYAETTAAGDTLGARTVTPAATGIDVSGNDNIMYVIEIDAAELPAGKPNLYLKWSAPGGATIASAMAVLSDARYGSDQSPTVIA